MDGLKTNIQEQWLLEAVLGKQQTGFFFYCWYLGIYLVTNFHLLWTVCFQSSTRLVFLHLESVCTYACMCVCVFRLLCSWAQLTSLQNLSRPVVLEMDVSHQKPLQGLSQYWTILQSFSSQCSILVQILYFMKKSVYYNLKGQLYSVISEMPAQASILCQ